MTEGYSGAGFDLDLRYGKAREDALASILRGGHTVEVKSDRICRRTGNLFVEYRQKGRASGINVTTADYWAFEYDDDCWVIVPTARLKQLCRLAALQDRTASGGDFNQYDGILLPISWLVDRQKGGNNGQLGILHEAAGQPERPSDGNGTEPAGEGRLATGGDVPRTGNLRTESGNAETGEEEVQVGFWDGQAEGE